MPQQHTTTLNRCCCFWLRDGRTRSAPGVARVFLLLPGVIIVSKHILAHKVFTKHSASLIAAIMGGVADTLAAVTSSRHRTKSGRCVRSEGVTNNMYP
ncbi:hypothetical protein M3J09_005820 [Ascochyta lentis]